MERRESFAKSSMDSKSKELRFKVTFRTTLFALLLGVLLTSLISLGISGYIYARFAVSNLGDQVLDQTAARIDQHIRPKRLRDFLRIVGLIQRITNQSRNTFLKLLQPAPAFPIFHLDLRRENTITVSATAMASSQPYGWSRRNQVTTTSLNS